MNTDFETRIATLEAVVAVLQQRQERQDQEHASLLTRTVEPLAELETTLDLTREHMDQRLQEVLSANTTIDVTNPAFMKVMEMLLDHIDKRHKLVDQRIDAVQDGIIKIFGSPVGKVGE